MPKRFFFSSALFAFFSMLITSNAWAQSSATGEFNPITTAVPFITIAPDARGGALADMGVASQPDAFSSHYNSAKLPYIKPTTGVGISYSPWLKGIAPDINLLYLSGFYKMRKNQVVAGSIRYFHLGEIAFTNMNGESLGNREPLEYALDLTYSRMLTNNLSGAITARYVYSNLTLNQEVEGTVSKAGQSVAADVSIFQRFPVQFDRTSGSFSWGLNISNIGTKVSYTDDKTEKDFIPTNLRLGPNLTLDLDDYNQVSFMAEFNKLLVTSDITADGNSPDVSVPVSMIHSFYDAPGGLKEELSEINLAAGFEYWYAQQFAVRGGIFYEDTNKGDRKFVTAGVGFRYNVLGIDVSYIVPYNKPDQSGGTNPLAHTFRFSLTMDFGQQD